MNKKVFIIVSSILLLTLASCGTKTDTSSSNVTSGGETAQEVEVKKETKAAPGSFADMSAAPFEYRDYNGQDLSSIGKDTVLYFAQASCGTCQKTDADIKAQEELPKGLSIIKVDYDNATELNEKYGVTTKHTFVLINKKGEEVAKEVGLATTADIAAFAKEHGGMMKQYDMSNAPTGYRDYNGQDLSNVGKETVLYFSQASCGTCQKTDADIKAQGELPNGLSIIKVDFDNDTELNKKYGVTTKHTFVLIDENGEEIAKEIGLAKTSDIIEFVEKNSQESASSNTLGAVATGVAGVASAAKDTVADAATSVAETTTEVAKEVVETSTEVVEEVVEKTPIAASGNGMYKDYTGSITKDSVLFFHAKWCPSCVAADKNFSAENDLAINADVLKVDFDSSKALKEKYGVTSQHTFVRVDAQGQLVKKMTGGSKSSDLQALFN